MIRFPLMMTLACVLVALSGEVRAQETVDMPAIGFRVTVPDAWVDLNVEERSEVEPEFAFYHVQDRARGHFVAMRREACPLPEKQEAWINGEVVRGQLAEGDQLEELPQDAALDFDGRRGYRLTASRGDLLFHSVNFVWTEDGRCYRAELGAPQDGFESSPATFQQILNSIERLD